MATFTKVPFSGSTNGLGIVVAATASPGTTIHTAISNVYDWDEVWLWVMNVSAADCVATIQFGGTTEPNNNIILNIAAKDGPKCLCPGLILQNGLIIKAYGGVASSLVVYGYVNRITE
jgi:hypothetical protein